MHEQGTAEEEAALTLGARLADLQEGHPAQRQWGLLYGVLLCNARAMGEFGAVSVVSGHIRGQTNTMPLHVEILYNEYASSAPSPSPRSWRSGDRHPRCKSWLEWRYGGELAADGAIEPQGMTLTIDGLTRRFAPPRRWTELASLRRPGLRCAARAVGSGKTTLLRILGGLDTADGGSVTFGDQDWLRLSPRSVAPVSFPELRPVPSHDGRPQYRLRPPHALLAPPVPSVIRARVRSC
jgi:hypothetical protein